MRSLAENTFKSVASRIKNRERSFFNVPDGVGVVCDLPTSAIVEVSAACNHKCTFCSQKFTKKPQLLSVSLFQKFALSFAKAGGIEIGYYGGGEPLLNKRLEKMISFAKNEGIKRNFITTNGSLLFPERAEKLLSAGLNSVKFSINAFDRDSYLDVHGSDDWDTTLSNLLEFKELVERNQHRVPVELSVGIVRIPKYGEEKYDQFVKYLASYGIESIVTLAHSQNGDAKIFASDSKVVVSDVFFNENSLSSMPCGYLFNRLHLNSLGRLHACCIDYSRALDFGSLWYDDLIDVWNSTSAQSLRAQHLAQRLEDLPEKCRMCLAS